MIKKRRENTVKDQAFPLRKLVLNWSTLPGKEGTKKLAVEWHKNIEELMKVEPEDKLALSTRSSASNDSLDDSLGASTRSFEDMADSRGSPSVSRVRWPEGMVYPLRGVFYRRNRPRGEGGSGRP